MDKLKKEYMIVKTKMDVIISVVTNMVDWFVLGLTDVRDTDRIRIEDVLRYNKCPACSKKFDVNKGICKYCKFPLDKKLLKDMKTLHKKFISLTDELEKNNMRVSFKDQEEFKEEYWKIYNSYKRKMKKFIKGVPKGPHVI